MMTDRIGGLRKIERPGKDEYPAYSEIYMRLVGDGGRVLQDMRESLKRIRHFISELPQEKLYYRYADGKWTIKEILVHIVDDERIFAYRALRYARNDETPLHGFDENRFARYSDANERSLDSIFDEYESVRNATLTLFEYLPGDAFLRKGSGIDHDGSVINTRTVRALAYHIAGHELRHIKIIKERYLGLSTENGII